MTLEKEGQIVLHFAAAYGFRNIQNLVQKLKRGRCPYHYVEVMACPAGSWGGARFSQRARGPFPGPGLWAVSHQGRRGGGGARGSGGSGGPVLGGVVLCFPTPLPHSPV